MDLLSINKKDANADEEHGPSADSEDINERIAARRLRIKKKTDAQQQKKQSGLSAPVVEVEKKKELSKGRKQVQDSRARLVKLEKDGLELVTNIRVAGDAREHARRTEEEEVMRLRKERLEQEGKAATEKFEEITKKWETAQNKEIPQELHELLMDQKHLCDSMIDEKNKLINDFKHELRHKDDSYVKALKKYTEEIDLLIERMKDQTLSMRKFYLEELVNVESAFINERKELLDKHRKEWEDKMEERKTKELAFLEERFRRVERNEAELSALRVRDAEEYNEIKIKLETDVQILEQQLQQMKATYQLNQEKLEYNYQVLQKRDEENAKTKAQQKRKITKLQDTLTNLKKKLAKQIKQYNDENQQLSEEYKRVNDMFNDLQLKSKHFLSVDLKKFHDIWKMNEDQCKEFACNLLDADRILHEQQLGLEWQSPDISFMSNVGPLNGAEQLKTGKEFVSDLLSSENDEEDENNEDDMLDEDEYYYQQESTGSKSEFMTLTQQATNTSIGTDKTGGGGSGVGGVDQEPSGDLSAAAAATTGAAQDRSSVGGGGRKKSVKFPKEASLFREASHDIILNLSKTTLRNIVMLICDEAGFLLEQKLVHLLEPLEKNEKSMVKLDSIFKALGVETENDVRLLAQYFINHRQYRELIKSSAFTHKLGGDQSSTAAAAVIGVTMTNSATASANSGDEATSQQSTGTTALLPPVVAKTVPNDSIQLIHSNEVLTALKTFVTLHHKSDKQQKLAKFRLDNLDNRNDSTDQEYWEKYEHLIGEKNEKLWDAMLYALQKYHGILNRRSELIDENKALANQNIELRMLLAQYMQSSVNQELEIPPTKMLQMEYSSNK